MGWYYSRADIGRLKFWLWLAHRTAVAVAVCLVFFEWTYLPPSRPYRLNRPFYFNLSDRPP